MRLLENVDAGGLHLSESLSQHVVLLPTSNQRVKGAEDDLCGRAIQRTSLFSNLSQKELFSYVAHSSLC